MAKMGSVSKPVLKRMKDVMPFGQFKGKTVRYILDHNPSYILWLDIESVAVVGQDIVEEAIELDFSNTMSGFVDDTFGHNYSSYFDEPF